MTRQKQFLNVVDRDEAQRRFESAIELTTLGIECVALANALTRILADDVYSQNNVPGFDRSNFDGFAVHASDTHGATEQQPVELVRHSESIAAGDQVDFVLPKGHAVSIATGGMLPRGANAICLVEHTTQSHDHSIQISKGVHSGFGVSYTGTDISQGELVLRSGQVLTSRETGVLAAIGENSVSVFRRPRVAVISTGNEIVPPGDPIVPGQVYDSNARIIADAVREAGGDPIEMGIAIDQRDRLEEIVQQALNGSDMVLLSGGTSKGEGDLCYDVVSALPEPGIVCHGVALKPGKPICLAVAGKTPVVVLPGFPTSAIFTFHEFVAPVIRKFAGHDQDARRTVSAQLTHKIVSEVGRQEYFLVGLTSDPSEQDSFRAFGMGKGSGSVTAFSRADGFVTIDRHTELVEAGSAVKVSLIGKDWKPADLVIIGSHCPRLDQILSQLNRSGIRSKWISVGSTAGLRAIQNGDGDIAGLHLLDDESGTYNLPFINNDIHLEKGYRRRQGIVFRRGDFKFEDARLERSSASFPLAELFRSELMMINRNQGSGTRILIDRYLRGLNVEEHPQGYQVQVSNHSAVCAAIAQGRADWGIATEHSVQSAALGFYALQDEEYDFAIRKSNLEKPAVQQFLKYLKRQQQVEINS